MNSLSDLANKLQLSVKNLLMIVGGLVLVWFALGGRKTVYRRARRTVKRTTRAVRTRYGRYRTSRANAAYYRAASRATTARGRALAVRRKYSR